ncbi:hypothetical protein [Geomonas paludis]|uniref:Uncharacterized protein n=1 Tax=Geomonas paludis TaxID=2740185 RepID=A0A6V8MV66_9BACT|nr:hypothetical protein [Geomonas paludis]GFO63617.1 hypothetical protein GMPD_15360 [Geomonas paludis]
MRVKEHLPVRLEPDLLERLGTMATSRCMEITGLISEALDALERAETFEEQIAEVIERLELLEEKMEEASFNEKERLEYLFRLVETELRSHSQAIQARLDRVVPPRTS